MKVMSILYNYLLTHCIKQGFIWKREKIIHLLLNITSKQQNKVMLTLNLK